MTKQGLVTQNLLTRLTPEMAQGFRAAGFWTGETIYGCVQQNAQANPERTAVRDRNGIVNYRTLVRLADGAARELEVAGLRPGNRVASWLSSRIETIVFFLACSRNGYVFCPSLHRTHAASEVSDLLRRMRASAFISEEGFGARSEADDIFTMAGAIESVRKIYRLPAVEIGAKLAASGMPESIPSPDADGIVYLAFTSGTSGEPKGVLHSNNTLLANARALAKDWHFNVDSVIYSISPLSHNLGFGAMILALFAGGELVLHDLPRKTVLLERLRETRTTFVFGVPTHAIDLIGELETADAATLPELKGFRISGAAASPDLVAKLLDYGIVPQSGYGMTEACSHHYTMRDDPPAVLATTSGRACPGYEVAIFDTNDAATRLGTGMVGQIGGRGASLMLGYFDDQAATESAFNVDGWFMTGDLGRLDERGYLQVIGRLKDVIIRGGHNIHPARIEMLAMRHPRVARAAAVGIMDERLGEKVCLVISAKNGASIQADELLSHLHMEGLSPYDMPEYFLQIDELPLSASGKVLKRALMDSLRTTFRPRPVRWRK